MSTVLFQMAQWEANEVVVRESVCGCGLEKDEKCAGEETEG